MSHDNQVDNKSKNRSFSRILEESLSRRQVIAGGLGVAITGFFSHSIGANDDKPNTLGNANKPLIDFKPVPMKKGTGAWPAISDDYQFETLIPWGEPLQPNGPAYSYPPNAVSQAEQIGIGHDGMAFFPIETGKFGRGGDEHGVLAINHEFGRNKHVLGKTHPESLEDVRTSQHAHGLSIVEISKTSGQWRQLLSKKSRRIHVNTPVKFSGPAALHALLRTKKGNAPTGTVNNCSNGKTPWGTYLTCEENFNGYFGATNQKAPWVATEEQWRYGFSLSGFGYGWEKFDPRFDLSDAEYMNEENRFGWVVEIDPMDPTQTPVKRTALGRFKHEGVAITEGKDGRIVGYMGDDQRFDYIYKFVSDDNWKAMRARGESPLDLGKLYVAKFSDDGTGEWLELTIKNALIAKRFSSQAEVLIYARVAADILGATPMDRPEWTTVAPNGDVYCTLTNNIQRTEKDAANPIAPNKDGHIIRWRDEDNHIGTRFTWDIFLMARDSHGAEESYSSPDGIWADPDGRLFIQTDGKQKKGLNNQLLIADAKTGKLRRLFTGVAKSEITGITLTPNRRTLFINIQHPGNGDPSKTNFPAATDGETVPRDTTLVITRKNGGIIGS